MKYKEGFKSFVLYAVLGGLFIVGVVGLYSLVSMITTNLLMMRR